MHEPMPMLPALSPAEPPAFIPPGLPSVDAVAAPTFPVLAACVPPALADLAIIPPGIWLAYLERLTASTLPRAA